jgi:alginate O-acetyltransferase complex protein AlgI
MIFSTPIFIYFFFPAVIIAYFGARFLFAASGARASLGAGNWVLLAASLVFYWWGETYLSALLWLSIAFNYVVGLWIGSRGGIGGSRAPIAVGVIGNLAFLIAFKYANFFIANINAALGTILPYVIFKPEDPFPEAQQIIGISFFTFQALSYLIDLQRGHIRTERNPSLLALYISLFPQLVAGPIVRYREIARQLRERAWRDHDIPGGMERFVIGLFKKVVIADEVGKVSDAAYAMAGAGDPLSSPVAWLAMIAYALQIYFDFSGYSDMAIGLGRMLGFRFPENFAHPYMSTSVTEFWRRWHMTLSRFFRDYVYIPLGGNRVRPWRRYFNLWAVFLTCGLWHGASWTFVIWGAWQGLFLTLERLGLDRALAASPRVLCHLYVTLTFLFGWVFFRSQSLGEAQAMFTGALAGGGWQQVLTEVGNVANAYQLTVILLGCLLVYPMRRRLELGYAMLVRKARALGPAIALGGNAAPALRQPAASALAVGALVAGRSTAYLFAGLFALAAMAGNTHQAFIYFRF